MIGCHTVLDEFDDNFDKWFMEMREVNDNIAKSNKRCLALLDDYSKSLAEHKKEHQEREKEHKKINKEHDEWLREFDKELEKYGLRWQWSDDMNRLTKQTARPKQG